MIMCFTVKITADALKLENRYKFKAQANTLQFKGGEKLSGFAHPQLPILIDGTIQLARWGLIPYWTKDREAALSLQNQTLNARIETIHEKASFKKAIASQRCILPVNAFYETQHRGKEKVPFLLHPNQDEFFHIAGIWDTWISPQSKTTVNTFSIVTCEANPLMAEIHNTKKRMPLLLGNNQWEDWLKPQFNIDEFIHQTLPIPDERLRSECLVNLLF